MNDEKTNKIISSEELDDVLPKYEPIKLSGKNLAQNYVSAFNTGMNIYQCVNQLQGYIEWVVKAVNDVVKSWNVQVGESIDQSKAIARETTTEQFNKEWTNKQPELIEQVNTLTTNQFNNEKFVFNAELDTLNARMDKLNARMDTLNARMDTFSNPNLLINPDFRINQRGSANYTSNEYTVDRWKINNGTVKTSLSGVTVTLNNKGQFIQLFENTLNGTYTATIKVTSITGDCMLFIGEHSLKLNKAGTFTIVESGSITGISLYKSTAGTCTINVEYIKLEQGSVATPFVAPNYAEELSKCRRFYTIIGNTLIGYVMSTVSFYMGITEPLSIRTGGTVVLEGDNSTNYLRVDGKSTKVNIDVNKSIYDINYIRLYLANTTSEYDSRVCALDCSSAIIAIDAEIY